MIHGANNAIGAATAKEARTLNLMFAQSTLWYLPESALPCRLDNSGSVTPPSNPGRNSIANLQRSAALKTPISAYPPAVFTRIIFAIHVEGMQTAPTRSIGKLNLINTAASFRA